MMNGIFGILLILVVLFLLCKAQKEGFASSPATAIQLSASSGYYPFWRYGYGYKYPYYRFKYPYHTHYPMGNKGYNDYMFYEHYPRPQGFYRF